MAIEKEAKVLLMYAQFIDRQNDIHTETRIETVTKQNSLNAEKLAEMIKQGIKEQERNDRRLR